MNTNATAVVIPMRAAAAVLGVPAAPKQTAPTVLNTEFVQRLRALNEAARWLRAAGHRPIDEQAKGDVPVVVVDEQAAPFLITAACGFNSRRVNPSTRICWVVLRGCVINWFEKV